MIKLQMNLISLGSFRKREAIITSLNPKAIGDNDGKHISKFSVTMGDFISYLIKQEIEREFTAKEVKENFKINSLKTYYYKGKIGIMFNIMIKKYRESLPNLFTKTKEIAKKILIFYPSFKDITEIEINDTLNKKIRIYTKKAIME